MQIAALIAGSVVSATVEAEEVVGATAGVEKVVALVVEAAGAFAGGISPPASGCLDASGSFLSESFPFLESFFSLRLIFVTAFRNATDIVEGRGSAIQVALGCAKQQSYSRTTESRNWRDVQV